MKYIEEFEIKIYFTPPFKPKALWVYFKNAKGGRVYIGYSGNLVRRFKQHRRRFSQDNLIYYEACLYEKDARKREQKLKYYGSPISS